MDKNNNDNNRNNNNDIDINDTMQRHEHIRQSRAKHTESEKHKKHLNDIGQLELDIDKYNTNANTNANNNDNNIDGSSNQDKINDVNKEVQELNKLKEKLGVSDLIKKIDDISNALTGLLEEKNNANENKVRESEIHENDTNYETTNGIRMKQIPLFNNNSIGMIKFPSVSSKLDEGITKEHLAKLLVKREQEYQKEYQAELKQEREYKLKNIDKCKIIKNNIKIILDIQGKSATWLQKVTQIPKSTLSSIIYNTNNVTLENAFKIALALEEDVETLFDMDVQINDNQDNNQDNEK